MATKKTKIPDKKVKVNSVKNINKTNQTKKEAPTGIKVIAFIHCIFGIFILIFTFYTIIGFIRHYGPIFKLVDLFIVLLIIPAIFLLKGNNLARVTIISVYILFILEAIYELIKGEDYFSTIFFILIFGIGICYLLFNKKVKEFFS
jgi:hypothetical protein